MTKPLPKLIGVTGYARHGKGTVAAVLAGSGYEEAQFSAPLKELALRIDPWIDDLASEDSTFRYHFGRLSNIVRDWGVEGAKTLPEVRRFYQQLGDEARDVLGQDVWIGALAERLGVYRPEDTRRIVISDLRYVNEAAWVRRMGGEVWRVTRPDFDNGVDPNHPSEREVPALLADLDILNDGTLAEFEEKVRTYITSRVLMAAVAR